jgi:hypothetical protein
MPVEQAFWDWLLADAKKWGLHTYEQDWLCEDTAPPRLFPRRPFPAQLVQSPDSL